MKAENIPAFPFGTKETSYDSYGGSRSDVSTSHHEGMTLRDFFAAAALQGSLSTYRSGGFEADQAQLAESCYLYADAMLLARQKGPQ